MSAASDRRRHHGKIVNAGRLAARGDTGRDELRNRMDGALASSMSAA
jgi:hypothetical protein